MFLLIYNFVSGLPVGAFSTKPTQFCKVLRKQLYFYRCFYLRRIILFFTLPSSWRWHQLSAHEAFSSSFVPYFQQSLKKRIIKRVYYCPMSTTSILQCKLCFTKQDLLRHSSDLFRDSICLCFVQLELFNLSSYG